MTMITEPLKHCSLCPRLVKFRQENIVKNPSWYNAPVPSLGTDDASLLIVGLAPGLKGANRTGRPFTGDDSGKLLFSTLLKFGFARETQTTSQNNFDEIELIDCMITNAVRCVPPKNKPLGSEINTCRKYLKSQIKTLKNLKAILALGRIAHDTTLTAMEKPKKDFIFSHNTKHQLQKNITLFDSYHCSKYNINTGRLTTEMFYSAFKEIKAHLR